MEGRARGGWKAASDGVSEGREVLAMTMRHDEACPIWGEVAEVTSGIFDGWTVTGFRTDGAYRIARSVVEQTRTLTPDAKARLTTWIVDQHRAGDTEPMINSGVIESVKDRRSLNYRQKVDRFFLMLRAHDISLTQNVRIFGAQDETTLKWRGVTSAWLEVRQGAELSSLIAALKDEGLLRSDVSDIVMSSAKGLQRLDDLEFSGAESDQAFVAMWFSKGLDTAWIDGFTQGISDVGFRPFRVDKKEHANKIDDEIIAEIRRSRFVVADFTCELIEKNEGLISAPRGGVYYEAGFAQGLGIPVIWTVRDDCIDYVHFDTRQYAHIVWSDPEDLRVKLRNRIGAVIGVRGNN